MKKFCVTIKLTYTVIYDDDYYDTCEYNYENNTVHLNEFMNGYICDLGGKNTQRYIIYAQCIQEYISSEYTNVTFTNIIYYDGHISFMITFNETNYYMTDEYTKDGLVADLDITTLSEWLEDNNLEDTHFMDDGPGSPYLYPLNYCPTKDDEYDDIVFAHIDYRDNINIKEIHESD